MIDLDKYLEHLKSRTFKITFGVWEIEYTFGYYLVINSDSCAIMHCYYCRNYYNNYSEDSVGKAGSSPAHAFALFRYSGEDAYDEEKLKYICETLFEGNLKVKRIDK